MNIEVEILNKIGITGRLVIGIKSLMRVYNGDGRNITNINFKISSLDENPFDWVFDQNKNVIPQLRVESKILKMDNSYRNVDKEKKLPIIKNIFSKVKIKDHIIQKIHPEINERTLGVHIRLTDMNVFHAKDYGKITYGKYIEIIKRAMDSGLYNNIFVASDNEESIYKLKKDFNVIYNEDLINRNSVEGNGMEYNVLLRNNLVNKEFWEDTYLEMMCLARCGSIVKNTSSLSTCSVFFSNTIDKIYMV